jgi:hypothetical protein
MSPWLKGVLQECCTAPRCAAMTFNIARGKGGRTRDELMSSARFGSSQCALLLKGSERQQQRPPHPPAAASAAAAAVLLLLLLLRCSW